MDVADIVKRFLEENGFDGLYTDECGCKKDNLFPCDSDGAKYCVPGYQGPCHCGEDHGFHVGPKK